jgi:hypothetical protein
MILKWTVSHAVSVTKWIVSRVVPVWAKPALAVLICLVSLSVLQSAVAADDPDWVEDAPGPSPRVEKQGDKTVLKLGIEHSGQLDPVPDNLQAGSIFDSRLLEGGSDKLTWYRIPDWLAGQWQRRMETRVFSQDCASGYTDRSQNTFMSEQVAAFGVQRDKQGHIWNCNLKPQAISDHGSYQSIALMRAKEPIRVTDTEIIFREIYTVLDVQKQSKLITDSYMMEALTRHRPLSDNQIETQMSFEVYNAGGRPRSIQENTATDRRIGPVELIDSYKGRDLKKEFAEFLRNTNQDALVP